QRAIQNSCSTLRSSAWASLIASRADGVKTPFSTVFTVLRVTPTRSASSACVRPSSVLRSLIRFERRSAILERTPLEHAPADQRGGNAGGGHHMDRLTGGQRLDHGQE